jgi:hypothetical protein
MTERACQVLETSGHTTELLPYGSAGPARLCRIANVVIKAHFPNRELPALFVLNHVNLFPDPTENESLAVPFNFWAHGIRCCLRPPEYGGRCGLVVDDETFPFQWDKEKLYFNISRPTEEDMSTLEWFELTSPNPDLATRIRRTRHDYQEEKWDAQFNELLAFKAQHGHCRVPQNYESNPALSHWVKRQRYQYKCKREGKVSGISESRIQKLEQIGFVWDAQELLWQTRFDELKVYRLKHGHCNVPYNYDVNRKLPTWIKCQRRQYKLRHEEQPSNMTQERIDLLHGLEFKWGQRESTVADR